MNKPVHKLVYKICKFQGIYFLYFKLNVKLVLLNVY